MELMSNYCKIVEVMVYINKSAVSYNTNGQFEFKTKKGNTTISAHLKMGKVT